MGDESRRGVEPGLARGGAGPNLLDGDRLEVTSAWEISVNLGKMTRGIVLWERVK